MTPPDKPLNGNQSKRNWIVAGAILGVLLLAWLFGALGSAGPERGAVFLACEDSSFMTGADLLLDGGYSAR